jgi:type I restriction enzyme S subunit
MTLDTFFEKFELLADAPDAVGRMRELVLELAVRGNLSERNPVDQSDPIWRQFTAEFDQREYSYDPGPPPPFEIPDDWRWVALDDLGSKKARNTAEDDLPVSFIPMALVPVSVGGRISSEERRWGDVKKAFTHFADGDVVMAKITPCFENGKSAVIRGLLNGIGAGTTELHVFRRSTEVIEPEYVLLYLKTRGFISRGERVMTGSAGQKRVPRDYFGGTDFPLPPPAEQKRIVAKVEELMALCDRLEAQQQERATRHAALARASLSRFAEAPTPAHLNLLFHKSCSIPPEELRKAILAMAVRGKLVPQDPQDEPAARVLERIDAAPKRGMRTRTTHESDGDEPTDFTPLFELPPGWEWVQFRRLPLHATVGLDRGRAMQGADKAVGYFKMNNIRNSGGVDLSDLTRIDATPDEIEAFALEDGDFLFNTRNSRELVGKTCVFRSPSSDPILNNNNILRVKFIDGFSPEFIDYWFRSPEGSAELEKLKSNTTNVCAIYQGKLSGFPCVVPPLAEQRRIVAKVEQLMALVDRLEAQLAASRKNAGKLLEAVVAELSHSAAGVLPEKASPSAATVK